MSIKISGGRVCFPKRDALALENECRKPPIAGKFGPHYWISGCFPDTVNVSPEDDGIEGSTKVFQIFNQVHMARPRALQPRDKFVL